VPVEGRVERHAFSLQRARMSRAAAERNYAAALKEMGAVQVNKVQPASTALVAAHKGQKNKQDKTLDKLGLLNLDANYSSYLIRTPTSNIWIVVAIDEQNVNTVAIEEKQAGPAPVHVSAAADDSSFIPN
jgi:hypothetical protein